MSIIITILILALVYYIINWAISAVPIGAPFDVIIRFIVILYIVITLLNLLPGVNIPFAFRL